MRLDRGGVTLALDEAADEAGLAGVWVADYYQVYLHLVSGLLVLHLYYNRSLMVCIIS